MTRRASRHLRLQQPDRDDLLYKAHALWSATCGMMRQLQVDGDDYRAAQAMASALAEFARRISGGATDFGAMISSGYRGANSWLDTVDDYEASIDEAIAVCDGDPRAAIRSLLIMTEYLEAEMEAMT